MNARSPFLTPALSWRRVLLDGSAINGTVATLIIGSLAINAEMWLHDYPPDIQARFGPKSRKAQLQTALLAPLFIGFLLGGILLSLRRLRQERGVLPFAVAFWHSYALLAFFWLFDLLVLDWFILGTLQPSFMVLPGTEGMAGYHDRAFHLKVSREAMHRDGETRECHMSYSPRNGPCSVTALADTSGAPSRYNLLFW
jgi:hypothetical protein